MDTSIVDVMVVPLPDTVQVYVPDWPGTTAVALARVITLPVVVLKFSTFKLESRFPVLLYISVNDQEIVGKGSPVPEHLRDISTPGFSSIKFVLGNCPLAFIKVIFGAVAVEELEPLKPEDDDEPEAKPATKTKHRFV